MREELRVGDRLIFETRDFLAFTPFAPKFSFEFCILPKKHGCAFQDIKESEREDLSTMLLTMLRKMRRVLKDPPYHYVIHTAPNRVPRRNHWHTLGDDFHWHMEIIPRLPGARGVEWGSDFYVLTTSPEDAAQYLREA
jgi:UDPglucose--hexose-1-phosphate uridylyltransferase